MQPSERVREDVREFAPYVPGLSMDEIRERYGLNRIIKLASNENPLGASPLVKRVLARKADTVFRYPRSGNPALVAGFAAAHGLPAACVVAGNGSDEIIDLLVRVTAQPGRDNVVAFSPCFSIYVQQTRLCGVELRQQPLGPDFRFDFSALTRLVDEHTALVFVTNPDNPSGYAVPADELIRLARELPEKALLVVDEAYADFAEPEAAYSMLARFGQCDNVVVLRTFSKLYGLAGLRLGFGAMPEWLADTMLRVKLPFSVNLLAEAAGLAALEDKPFLEASRDTVGRGTPAPDPRAGRLRLPGVPLPGQFPHGDPAQAGPRRLRGLARPGHHRALAQKLRPAGQTADQHRQRRGKYRVARSHAGYSPSWPLSRRRAICW